MRAFALKNKGAILKKLCFVLFCFVYAGEGLAENTTAERIFVQKWGKNSSSKDSGFLPAKIALASSGETEEIASPGEQTPHAKQEMETALKANEPKLQSGGTPTSGPDKADEQTPHAKQETETALKANEPKLQSGGTPTSGPDKADEQTPHAKQETETALKANEPKLQSGGTPTSGPDKADEQTPHAKQEMEEIASPSESKWDMALDPEEHELFALTQKANSAADLPESQKTSPIEASWKTAFKAQKFDDNRSTKGSIVSTEIYGKINWDVAPSVFFQAQGLIIGRNGFTRTIYDRDDRLNGLYLFEGFFHWSAQPNLFLRFGNIQQGFLEAPLLITDKTFPSFMGSFALHSSPLYSLSLLLQAAIPDNASEMIRRDYQLKGEPLFLTSSAKLEWPDAPFESALKNTLTLFHYHSLSSAVAEQSRIYGNTIDRTGSDSTFKHAFLGFHNHLNIKKKLSDVWILELGLESLQNLAAKNASSEGMRIYGSAYHNYKDFAEIKYRGELFANQSDSSVAYYNSEVYGHNNRQGLLAGLQSHFYSSGLTFGLSFVYSSPINQPDQNPVGPLYSVIFSVMTNYISI